MEQVEDYLLIKESYLYGLMRGEIDKDRGLEREAVHGGKVKLGEIILMK